MVSKLTGLSIVEIKKKKSQLLQLFNCRFFVDFAVVFSSDFSGKMEEFVQNNGLKIFKHFCQSQQTTTWPIRDPATVDFLEKVDHTVDYIYMVSKVDRTVDFQDFHPTTVDFSKKSPATVDL
jgi:hypothetical protein